MKKEITNQILQEIREQITEGMKKGNNLYSFYYEKLSKEINKDKITIVFNISNNYYEYIDKKLSEMNLRRSELSEETFEDIYFSTFYNSMVKLLEDVIDNTDYIFIIIEKYLAIVHKKEYEYIGRDAEDLYTFKQRQK